MQFATPAFDRPSTLLRLSTETIKFEDDLGHPGRGLWQRRFAFRPTPARLSAVRLGSRSRNHVTTPLTTGDAMEVPLIFRFFHLGKLSVMAHCLGLDRLRYGCNKINEHDLDTLGQFW